MQSDTIIQLVPDPTLPKDSTHNTISTPYEDLPGSEKVGMTLDSHLKPSLNAKDNLTIPYISTPRSAPHPNFISNTSSCVQPHIE